MVYDDIVVGSGLTALATVMGLPAERRTLVLAGPAERRTDPYDAASGIPSASAGLGGLGSYWHGVIPIGPTPIAGAPVEAQRRLFKLFYPISGPEPASSAPEDAWLFVPRQPIRPERHWPRLAGRRPHLAIRSDSAVHLTTAPDGWRIATAAGLDLRARRVWLAAGALGTPGLLAASPEFAATVRPTASDHVIIYLGQLDRRRYPGISAPDVRPVTGGLWLRARRDPAGPALLTVKPARFDYRRLDAGIEQRAAFGLPTTGVLQKLWQARSPGLLSESVFNKLGWFPSSPILSVYAQVRVIDAYDFTPGVPGLRPRASITHAMNAYRDALQWPELSPSRRRDLFVRGIHLHRTIERSVWASTPAGIDEPTLRIVDPSALADIGATHHTFAAMTAAFQQAEASA